jgi:uncharacterized membrane protein YccC
LRFKLPKTAQKYISSFDFFRGLVVTAFLSVILFWGLSADRFPEALSLALGVMFGYFANIEGTNKHRIYGMVISLVWATFVMYVSLWAAENPSYIKIPLLSLLVFISSMISVYGYRGSMISFGGLFSVVLSFALHKTKLPVDIIIQNILIGGTAYVLVSSLSQWFYQKHHVRILLSECVTLTASYFRLSENLRWQTATHSTEKQHQLLKIQSQLNDKHEVLRSLLLSESNTLISSNSTRKYFLLFSEMINIYEVSIAKSDDYDAFLDELTEAHISKMDTFIEISNLLADNLDLLADSLQFGGNYWANDAIERLLETCENQISAYVAEVKLPKARDGALMMRSLLDHLAKEYQKLCLLDRIFNNIAEGDHPNVKTANLFITPQDYSFKTLKANFSLDSIIFRHSLRITVAVLIGFIIGRYLNEGQTNWIIVTVIVILRPNFGLSKNRALNRIVGTILGALITIGVVFVTDQSIVYGIVAIVSILIGFSFIQKNYRIASACITISILLLYVLKTDDAFYTILHRLSYTAIGVLIAYFAMYALWPVWEKGGIKVSLASAIQANAEYFNSVCEVYRSKENVSIEYKLIRKDAFLKNGNLNGSFQRMTEEPKSKRKPISNYYAVVLLNQTFLSAVAAFSAYIQGHKTTQPSLNFEHIVQAILTNMDLAVKTIQNEPISQAEISESQLADDFRTLESKYKQLNEIRNKELESGVLTLSTELRSQLQEAKTIIQQINWLYSLSENLRSSAKVIAELN